MALFSRRYSATEEIFDLLDNHVAAYVGDGIGERNLLWTSFNAVLRVATFLDSAVAGKSAQTLA